MWDNFKSRSDEGTKCCKKNSEHAAGNLRSLCLVRTLSWYISSCGTSQNGFLPQNLLVTNFPSYRRSVRYARILHPYFTSPIATINLFASASYYHFHRCPSKSTTRYMCFQNKTELFATPISRNSSTKAKELATASKFLGEGEPSRLNFRTAI